MSVLNRYGGANGNMTLGTSSSYSSDPYSRTAPEVEAPPGLLFLTWSDYYRGIPNVAKKTKSANTPTLPEPIAYPGQWVIYDGEPRRVIGGSVQQRTDRCGYPIYDNGQLAYDICLVVEGSGGYNVEVQPRSLRPHPRPDHGGSIYTPGEEAQMRLAAALEAELAERARVAEVARKAAEAARDATRVKEEALAAQPTPTLTPPVEATTQGAIDGAAAALFVAAAPRLAPYLPEALTRSPAFPLLLCWATYGVSVIFAQIPYASTLQAAALRGMRGCATIATAHYAGQLAEWVEGVLRLPQVRELFPEEAS